MEEKNVNKNLPLVKVQDVYKWYGKVQALKGINLEVYPGEIIGLIGDNGAGKSTLIKILSGVLSKNRGKIYWNGEETNISSVKDARNLGIETVYQDQAVIGCLSVAQNIFMGRQPVKSWGPIKILDKSKMRKESEKLAGDLKLHIPSPDQEVRFCSGGERQGVAISRAMYFQAKLVILDEPTTALAVSGVNKVLNFITRLKEEKIASIFVTHNLHHVYSVADRFVVLSRGEKVADVKKEETSIDDLENLQLRKMVTVT
ncbi:MAG: sugar ABC transporter ATP-binding protein [Candidatus Atribacteria bacterium]|nr:sugar ABC transporter ATP-binding protein [Candidatus Atribacteria bacterium]